MKNKNLPAKLLLVCSLITFSNAFSQDYEGIVKSYLLTQKSSKFAKQDLEKFVISNNDFSKSMNGNVVYVQQVYNGIPVHNSGATFLIKENEVSYFSDNFVKNYNVASSAKASLDKTAVFNKISGTLNQKNRSYKVLDFNDKDLPGDQAFAKGKLTYFHTDEGDLRLCYEFEFEEKGTANYWDVLADANTGEILKKYNLTVSDNFQQNPYGRDFSGLPEQTAKSDYRSDKNLKVNSSGAADNASYNVFALPLEAPNFGNRTLVTNPWFLDASPNGWQNDNSATYSITRGNNVYAYDDTANKNTPGSSPDGGAQRNFDFPFNYDGYPGENLSAATTNLFYINNKVHDIFYRLGFNETSKNFQASNFGKGGKENDYILAEAQDGGGKDNANFYTPSDGSNPRMQMYLWNPLVVNRLFYNAPAEAIPRLPATQNSTSFGAQLTATGVTGNVLLSPVYDACTVLPANFLLGKIGLAERGNCAFSDKAKNMQVAGAIAAIIYNAPNSSGFGGMGGEDASVIIPAVLIENSEGEYIKSQLNASKTVNVSLKYDESLVKFRDGSFDNAIIAHEYGHGISNRLSPTVTCLQTTSDNEQMGEGWSDFFALMITNQPGDNASIPRGVGTYVSSEASNGLGIRPAQYSPDFSINNYTYGKSNDTTFSTYVDKNGDTQVEEHQIGFLWTTMLWDLHWKYVQKYGYSSDVMANSTNGSTRALQMVLNGIKLEGCNPSFVAGRDAIIAADNAKTGGADRCMIWSVFAKRGLGVKAKPGLIKPATNSSANVIKAITDQVEDFTVPADCSALATTETVINKNISIYPNPAKNEFFVKVPSSQLGKLSIEVYDASGRLLTSDKVASSESISTSKLENGVYIVKIKGLGVDTSSKLVIKK